MIAMAYTATTEEYLNRINFCIVDSTEFLRPQACAVKHGDLAIGRSDQRLDQCGRMPSEQTLLLLPEDEIATYISP